MERQLDRKGQDCLSALGRHNNVTATNIILFYVQCSNDRVLDFLVRDQGRGVQDSASI